MRHSDDRSLGLSPAEEASTLLHLAANGGALAEVAGDDFPSANSRGFGVVVLDLVHMLGAPGEAVLIILPGLGELCCERRLHTSMRAGFMVVRVFDEMLLSSVSKQEALGGSQTSFNSLTSTWNGGMGVLQHMVPTLHKTILVAPTVEIRKKKN